MDWIELHQDGKPSAVNLRLVEVFQRPLDKESCYATRIFFIEAEDYIDVDETYEEIWNMIKEREAVSMKDKILSLCPECRKLMEGPYRVKGIVRATTEKKKCCENCGKRADKTLM